TTNSIADNPVERPEEDANMIIDDAATEQSEAEQMGTTNSHERSSSSPFNPLNISQAAETHPLAVARTEKPQGIETNAVIARARRILDTCRQAYITSVQAAQDANPESAEQARALTAKAWADVQYAQQELDRLTIVCQSSKNTGSPSETKTERTRLLVHKSFPTYGKGDKHTPAQFLYLLKLNAEEYVGEAAFLQNAERYVSFQIRNNIVKAAFQTELQRQRKKLATANGTVPEPLPWDIVAEAFKTAALNDEQRRRALNRLIKKGRHPNESYRQYVERLLTEFGSMESENGHWPLLQDLSDTVSEILPNMLLTYRAEMRNYSLTSFPDLRTFIRILSLQTGPTTDYDSYSDSDSQSDSDDSSDSGEADRKKSKGVKRHKRHRSQTASSRFNNKRREHRSDRHESHRTPRYTRTKHDGKFFCSRCGENSSHNTSDCKNCIFCGRRGHTVDECRNKQRYEGVTHGSQKNDTHNEHLHLNLPLTISSVAINPTQPETKTLPVGTNNVPPQEEMSEQSTDTDLARQPPSSASSYQTPQRTDSMVTHDAEQNKLSVDTPSDNANHTLLTNPNPVEHVKGDTSNAAYVSTSEHSFQSPQRRIDFAREYLGPRDMAINLSALYGLEKEIDEHDDHIADQEDDTKSTQDNVTISSINAEHSIDPKENRLILQLTVFGTPYQALLDPGATHSCIRHDITRFLEINITPVSGNITLADGVTTIPRIGRTENVING
ncbi:hypothetical protein BGW41_000605, partial [Actinomortierella wolfii]